MAHYCLEDEEDDHYEQGMACIKRDCERKHIRVCLPHQCDSWSIGGRKEVELLIADLQELLRNGL